MLRNAAGRHGRRLAAAEWGRRGLKRIVVKRMACAPEVKAGQTVVYETWTSSWGLRDDPPDQYPLGITTHKKEAEARAAAEAHMARTRDNGSLAVTHYLIEGEPTVQDLAEEAKKSRRGGRKLTNA